MRHPTAEWFRLGLVAAQAESIETGFIDEQRRFSTVSVNMPIGTFTASVMVASF